MRQNSFGNVKPLTSNRLEPLSSTRAKALSSERKTHVEVVCNHSMEDYSIYFSNKLNGIDTATKIRTMVKRVLELDGEDVSSSDIPLDVRGCLKLNNSNPDRIPRILHLYNVSFQEETIMKCRYKEIIPNVGQNLLRFFAIYNDETLKIVLIDPHHLVATEDYAKMFLKSKPLMRYDLALLKEYNLFK